MHDPKLDIRFARWRKVMANLVVGRGKPTVEFLMVRKIDLVDVSCQRPLAPFSQTDLVIFKLKVALSEISCRVRDDQLPVVYFEVETGLVNGLGKTLVATGEVG